MKVKIMKILIVLLVSASALFSTQARAEDISFKGYDLSVYQKYDKWYFAISWSIAAPIKSMDPMNQSNKPRKRLKQNAKISSWTTAGHSHSFFRKYYKVLA